MAILDLVTRKLQRSKESPAANCRRRFLGFFPRGFVDPKYLAWERNYKAEAHDEWQRVLGRNNFRSLLKSKKYIEIASAAAKIESRTNLLFSFEKMAFRDAVREIKGARIFAEGLYELLYGGGSEANKFDAWCQVIASLPRKQTRVLTHPVVTIFPFIAAPDRHIFLKPNTTRAAARDYGFNLNYNPRPSWEVYSSLLDFTETIRFDTADLAPRDMIDVQSFIWVVGSDEYKNF